MSAATAFDDIYDALKAACKAAGGIKRVAGILRPGYPKAEGWLDNCLNPDHAQKLDPEQVLEILRLGQLAGFHGAMHYVDHATGYAPSVPLAIESQLLAALVDARAARVALEDRERDLEELVKNPRLLATMRAAGLKVEP